MAAKLCKQNPEFHNIISKMFRLLKSHSSYQEPENSQLEWEKTTKRCQDEINYPKSFLELTSAKYFKNQLKIFIKQMKK